MFDSQAEALAGQGHRIILWDMRAHGLSRPNGTPITAEVLIDDAEALIDEFTPAEPPVLIGHSLGGNIAQELVRRDPHRYAGLAVLDSTWNTGPLTWLERRLLRLAASGLALIPSASLPRMMAAASAESEEARQDLRRAFSQVPKREFLDIWKATTAFVHPDANYHTPVPLCLIRGAADRTGNISKAMPAWAGFEGVEEHVVPDGGHVVTQDAPQAVSELLIRFLRTIE